MWKVHCEAQTEVDLRASYFHPTTSCSLDEYDNSRFGSELTHFCAEESVCDRYQNTLKIYAICDVMFQLMSQSQRPAFDMPKCQSEYEEGFPLGSVSMWLSKKIQL